MSPSTHLRNHLVEPPRKPSMTELYERSQQRDWGVDRTTITTSSVTSARAASTVELERRVWGDHMSRPPNEPFDERDLYAQNPDPFSAFSKTPKRQPNAGTRPLGMYEVPEPAIPVAPRQAGAGITLVIVLTVFALLLGTAIFLLST